MKTKHIIAALGIAVSPSNALAQSNSTHAEQRNSDLPVGATAGIIVGGLAVLAGLCWLLCHCYNKDKNDDQPNSYTPLTKTAQ